ncbi:RNA polymerase-binding protein DksA [Lysobacter claricitrinus]|uniref:RNA polymerase-binding protein DksA n=1 Tax=Lysobacter claricitrinus TaxID=3367728 RepID=UPI0037DAE674
MATKKTAKKAASPAKKSAAKPAVKKAAKPVAKPAAKKAVAKKVVAKKAPPKPAPKAKPAPAKKAMPAAAKKAVPAKKAAQVAKAPVKKAVAKAPAPSRAVETPARKPAVAKKAPVAAKQPVPAAKPVAQAAVARENTNERPTRSGSSGPAAGALKNGTPSTANSAARPSPQVESMSRNANKKSAAAPAAATGGPAVVVQRPSSGKVAVAVTASRGSAAAKTGARRIPEYKTDDASGRPIVPDGYKPKADEEYMNPLQLEYFRQRLLSWRGDLVEESKQTIENLREEVRDVGDEAERATRETENSLELRTRDRYRKLISKIDSTLKRIDSGDYGYCADTGEEIGLDRLEARLTAERTIDAQERWEHLQKQMGD